jgi:putative redox protein
MPYEATLTLRSIEDGFKFDGSIERVTVPLDTGPEATDINPVQMLLVALGGCSAMDVIGILRKKRLAVTAYEVVVTAERRDEYPRVFTSFELLHRVTGHAIPIAAVEEAARLSDTKYCTVHAMLEPAAPITTRVEVRPA